MSSVVVHNGEHFERGKARYVIFSLTLVSLIVASVIFENFFGAIILFLLVGGYILFALMRNRKISLRTSEQGLVVGEKIISRLQLQGRNMEVEAQSGIWKNLVIITKADKLIFTLDDTEANAKAFVQDLSHHIPFTENLVYSFTEKLIRKLKL